MDTSDREIVFDGQGVCNHCRIYETVVEQQVFYGEEGSRRLNQIVSQIKREGRTKAYDCIIGLSGGVDSTYTAYLVKRQGLRPLAVHVDNGWNSEIAVRNIESIVKILGIDLHTVVLDWDEFRSLQVAFLRASTPDSEIPTDHAIVSTLHHVAVEHNVRFIVSGGNFATELMVPRTWSHGHADWKYIKALNDQFGSRSIKTFPHDTFFDRKYYLPFLKKIETIMILNYMDYDKFKAIEIMKRELGWVSYGSKHFESIYTRYYQAYILPIKFGADKRRSHLSCLINNGRITREEALAEIQQPPLDKELLSDDHRFVIKKLGFTEHEFEEIMTAPPKTFWDYSSYELNPPMYDTIFIYLQQVPGLLWQSLNWPIRFFRGIASRTMRRLLTVGGNVARAMRKLGAAMSTGPKDVQ